MLQSEVQTAARSARLDGLSEAVLQALTAGASPTDLMATISATITDYQASRQEPLPGLLSCDGKEPIFDECPPGLIDLPSAAHKHGISSALLNTWIIRGHIKSYGRVRAPARGGGLHLIKETEILEYIKCRRRRGGRPKKTVYPK